MGGMTAPVVGSIGLPAWTAMVSIFIGWSFFDLWYNAFVVYGDQTTLWFEF